VRTAVVITMKKTLLISTMVAMCLVPLLVSTVHAATTPPQSLLRDLETIVQTADNQLFRGYVPTYTKQLKDALVHKIDVVIRMIDAGQYRAASTKLHNEIAPKLTICDTNRVRARSWLSYTHQPQADVYAFSAICRDLINRTSLMLT
jgi:Cu/Ag efflux pump CusA